MQLQTRLAHSAVLAATALLSAASDFEQDDTAEIDKIFDWATPTTPGCACAVKKDGKLIVTHTSGVRDWNAILSLSREKVDALAAIVRQRSLNFVPGDVGLHEQLLFQAAARLLQMALSPGGPSVSVSPP